VKYGFIARQRAIWPTRMLCRMLGVSHGGFYGWLGRAPSARSRESAHLTGRIRASLAESDRTYGSRRVWRDLRDWGERCSKNRVARLMRIAGIYARRKRRRPPQDVGTRAEHHIAPNILDRRFAVPGPNQQWAADFTYVWTAEGWLYVAAVLDLYSRRIVGWSLSPQMTA
jgi:putative transposase